MTTLTPNRRLAAWLQRQHQADTKAWVTPDILPLNSWVQRLWQTYLDQACGLPYLLLRPAQEIYLWEKVVADSAISQHLMQLSETAELAKSAWALLKQWRIELNHPAFSTAEDYQALRQWGQAFQALCEAEHYIDAASLADKVAELIQQGKLEAPPEIKLTGFNELSPQIRHLLDICQSKGCQISHEPLQAMSDQCQKLKLASLDDEIISMARWSQSIHAKTPNARIGCVIPLIDNMRDRVVQLFSQVFAPTAALNVDLQECPFNISIGKILSQYPVINAALKLLAMTPATISFDDMSFLLSTPFIGEANTERLIRAEYDAYLREQNSSRINLKKWFKSEKCPALIKRVSTFHEKLKTLPNTLTISEWRSVFNQLLRLLGWPGERKIDSEEYQTIQFWLDLLAELTQYDALSSTVDYHTALQLIRKLASRSAFQAQTPEAPIQVLGTLEAAGLPFDYLWVSGLDDQSWPAQPSPNPFIPKSLQREFHMPHATPERELIYCQQLTDQFRRSAKSIIFSYAEKKEDTECEASALIRSFKTITLDELNLPVYQSPSEQIYAGRLIIEWEDEQAPPLNPDQAMKGGINILKQQALCPFKAFAEHRLQARELPTPTPGLTAKDRGIVIHHILEMLWKDLQNQQALLDIDDLALSKLIDQSIDLALTKQIPAEALGTNYIALEKQRLHQLIWEWLLVEKNRPPFTVLEIEKEHTEKIGSLNLRCRLDRVDEIADGERLVIDYKTGKNNDVQNWFGERPTEPQLPFYALLNPTSTTALSYAIVNISQPGFKGVSGHDTEVPGVKTTKEPWQQVLSQWQTNLTQLAQDFYDGVASVNPKEGETTCSQCGLQALCRIQ